MAQLPRQPSKTPTAEVVSNAKAKAKPKKLPQKDGMAKVAMGLSKRFIGG